MVDPASSSLTVEIRTPQTSTTSKIPSTRETIETIDLVSDDEDVVVKKREPSTSPIAGNTSNMPTSVTIRKQQTPNTGVQDETPCRPPPFKKRKSPTSLALSIPVKASQNISANPPPSVPQQNSLTQV